MITFIKNNLFWVQGFWIAVILGIAALISYVFYPPLLVLVGGFFVFCLYFFRNPSRVCSDAKNDSSVIVSPADGKVVDISYDHDLKLHGYAYRISIFLSPLDVHVNWSPVAGAIEGIAYKPGKFVVAFAPKSSEINERNDIVIRNEHGDIMVRQIAGIVARRICCWINPGEHLKAGDTFGMIRFGSRVDLFLPENIAIDVKIGDRVYGGESVIGRFF